MRVTAYIVSKTGHNKLTSQLGFSKTSIMLKNLRKGAHIEDALTIARVELVALLMTIRVGLFSKKFLWELSQIKI
uniref:Uncharacterized protein n=1 Tax=Lepeophtheirus salmonis TaxID=72036 RepID=A0A0K2UFV5_LEPSM